MLSSPRAVPLADRAPANPVSDTTDDLFTALRDAMHRAALAEARVALLAEEVATLTRALETSVAAAMTEPTVIHHYHDAPSAFARLCAVVEASGAVEARGILPNGAWVRLAPLKP